MAKLHIGDGLALPLDAATQTFAFIARKGAGKTYAAGKLCELLLEAGVQCVILDTVGNWYGLRLAANGRDPGLDVPVIGGLRGDIPLQATAGELSADIVVDTGRSLILDLSQFSLGDRKKFATAFGHRLWQRKKGESHPSPVMLVIEESQLIVPQRVDSGSAQMVGIYEEIIRLGRNYGIGCTMISQRPQSVNKDVLNQTECLFVGQVNGAQERKSLKEWIAYQGMSTSLVDELPSLPVGTMYVWSPQWLNILQKTKVLPKQTYDASATPRVGEKRVARELKPLDLEDLKQKMAATIERAKAEDPRELRRRIGELERQLKNNPVAAVQEAAVQRAAIEAIDKRQRELVRQYQAIVEKLQAALVSVAKTAGQFVDLEMPQVKDQLPPLPSAKMGAPRRSARPSSASARPSFTPARPPSALNGQLTGPEQRILNAIAWLNSVGVVDPEQTAVAFLAGYTIGGGAFNNPRGSLSTKGLIEYLPGDRIRLTDEGEQRAESPSAPLDAEELQNRILEHLPGPERRLLAVLIDNPGGLPNEQLAELSGYSVNGGAYNNPRGRLRTLGLIDYERGLVKPKPLLFLEQ